MLRNRIKAACALLGGAALLALALPLMGAARPSIATIDATARARGNRRPLAITIGERLFAHVLPVQLLEIRASGIDDRSYIGLRFSGEKFHGAVTWPVLEAELVKSIAVAFAASTQVREVDCWIVEPIAIPRGTDVSGDKALPTEKNVLTISVRRGETAAHILRRLAHKSDLFLDPRWAARVITGDRSHA